MAHGIRGVSAFGKDPARAGADFAQGEEVGGDVLMRAGKAFFGNGKLVHQGKAEIVLFRSEVDFDEAGGELLSGFPTDLAAESRFVAGSAKAFELAKEIE